MNRMSRLAALAFLGGMLYCWGSVSLPMETYAADSSFPAESFLPLSPTLPNEQLDFTDESQTSCCAGDHITGIRSLSKPNHPPANMAPTGSSSEITGTGRAKSAFEQANPRYQSNGMQILPVSCSGFANLPEFASIRQGGPDTNAASLPIAPYSTNVSIRPGAVYATDPGKHHTSDFHIETAGGDSRIALSDVQSYSVCVARGHNEVMAANTDNGSIMAYNGDDRILLSGNNTNMLTWTGEGEDVIEIHQASPSGDGSGWNAYNIYKTAMSGGAGNDRVIIKDTPPGTKWCHIGVYRLYGETFHVVEFALPPSVAQGPRRQRMNIGQSVEWVIFQGKTYALSDFLSHGAPQETVARL